MDNNDIPIAEQPNDQLNPSSGLTPNIIEPTTMSPVTPNANPYSSQPLIQAQTIPAPTQPVISDFSVPQATQSAQPPAYGSIDAPTQPLSPAGQFPQYSAPQQFGQPTVGQFAAPPATAGRKLPTKLIAIIVSVVVVLIGGSSAAYFGIILPNNPEHLWGQALKNTGKGYTKFINYAKDTKAETGLNIKGTFKLDSSFKTDGSFEVKSDSKNATLKADVGLATTRMTVDGILITNEVSKTPDMYYKFSGIKGIAQEFGGVGPEFDSLDNQWIAIDHTLFDNTAEYASNGLLDSDLLSMSKQDWLDIAKSAGQTMDKYIFTDNPVTAVFKISKKVGEESKDGRKLYHYEAGISKDHTKEFISALKDQLKKTKLGTALGNDYQEAMDSLFLPASIDNIKDSDTIGVWVDKKTKLVRRIQLVDSDNSNTTIDLALNYNGGDEYPFEISATTDEDGIKDTITLGVTINSKTNAYKLNLKASSEQEGQDGLTFETNIDIKQSSDAVNVSKPAGAKSLIEAMNSIWSTDVLGAKTSQPWPAILGDIKAL